MKLQEIFQSKAQVRLVEHLLLHREKVFNQAGLARTLDVSPSTIARIAQPLVKSRIVLFESYGKGMKIFGLNQESQVTRNLIDFYDKLRSL